MSARLASIVLACTSLVATASGQAPQEQQEQQAPAEPQEHVTKPLPPPNPDELVLDERFRSAAHPGSPLVISGNEQDGNDLRSRTPALANVALRASAVDGDALRERLLAAYEDRATFDGPPVASVEARVAEQQKTKPSRSGGSAPQASSPWPAVVGLTIAALALVVFLARPRVRRA